MPGKAGEEMNNRFWQRSLDLIWVLLVAVLPITSMPLIVKFVGSSSVAAPAGVLAVILLIFGVLPMLYKKPVLPGQVRLFLLFALLTVFSTLFSLFIVPPAYKESVSWKSALTSLLPLAVGICFYLVPSVWAAGVQRLKWAFMAINWSGLVVILWCCLQVGSWHLFHAYPAWLDRIQNIVSVGKLYETRAAGFALEPSWLAHQLNLLYLPYWLAATLKRFSVYPYRFFKLSFENFLLAGGIGALVLSFSRVGWLAFFLVIGYILVWLNVRLVRWLTDPNRPGSWSNRPGKTLHSGLLRWSVSLGLLLVYLAALAGAGWAFSRLDKRMASMFTFDASLENPVLAYANALKFGERVVYWQTGWNIFTDHPWLGVGLGQAGYYFPQEMPSYGWYLEEVRQLMYHSQTLMNIKSLWIRLLAETGAVGFVLFAIWYIAMAFSAIYLAKRSSPIISITGWMGGLTLLAFLLEGFSIDSFGLPYLWFSMGLVTAVTSLKEDIEPHG